jgi:hypothetical protein
MTEANPVPGREGQTYPQAEPLLAEILASGHPQTGPAKRKTRNRRTLLVAAVAAVVLAGAGVAGIRLLNADPGGETADEPHYTTTAALENSADAIVRGTITGTRTQTDETIATVRVTAVAKGDVATGTPVDVAYATAGPEIPGGLHKGGDFVFLLQPRDATLWNLVNTDQGYYPISGGKAKPDADNDVRLSSDVLKKLGLE